MVKFYNILLFLMPFSKIIIDEMKSGKRLHMSCFKDICNREICKVL